MNKYLLYGLKWQAGTPIVAVGMWALTQKAGMGYLAATVVVNIIGAVIFYKIDEYIFKKK